MRLALLAKLRAHGSNERDVSSYRQRRPPHISASSLPSAALSQRDPKFRSPTAGVASITQDALRLGALVPQTANHRLQRVAAAVLRRFGWSITGTFPNLSRFVVIVAPHTSNWDLPLLLVAKWALGIDPRWMAKHSIFRPPLGWFLRNLGGIPVQRSHAHNVVDYSVQLFAERSALVLALAPEGTRKLVPRWKTGFWHIARGARVPIVCLELDFGRKQLRVGAVFDVSEPASSEIGSPEIASGTPDTRGTDSTPSTPAAISLRTLSAEDGIARIRASFAGVLGYHPEQHN